MLSRRSILFLIFLLSNFSSSYAIDLNSAIEKSLKRSPFLKALEEEVKGIEGKSLLYKSYFNPTIYFEFGNFGTSIEGAFPYPIYRFSFSQPLPIYRFGTLMNDTVKYEVLSFKERIKNEKNRLISEVYNTFYSALYKKELISIAEENLKLTEEIYNFVKKLFELGEVTELELLRAERELELVKSELELSKNDYENTIRYLSYLVGEEIKDLEGELGELREVKDLNPNELPQVRQYLYMIESLQKSIQLERALAKPHLSAEFITEKVSQTSYGIRVGLSATISLFYRRESEILLLSSQMRSLENLKNLEILKIKSEYENILNRYKVLKDRIHKIETYLIPKASKELNLAIKSYMMRNITTFELSETKRRYIEILKYKMNLLMEAHSEYTKFILLGGEL